MPGTDEGELRASGYVGRLQEFGYGLASPLYDAFVAYAMRPMGGERRVRGDIARWLEAEPGHRILSLCCGTGSTDRAVLERVPDARITGIDLGRGQLARAQRLDTTGAIEYRHGDASDTGLAAASFDRVFVVGALHEMPRSLRARVLAEARRVIKPDGRFLAFEPGQTETRGSARRRSLALFLWVPGNPETRTTYDLIENGLAKELREAGFEPVTRHTTEPDWFEGILAKPV